MIKTSFLWSAKWEQAMCSATHLACFRNHLHINNHRQDNHSRVQVTPLALCQDAPIVPCAVEKRQQLTFVSDHMSSQLTPLCPTRVSYGTCVLGTPQMIRDFHLGWATQTKPARERIDFSLCAVIYACPSRTHLVYGFFRSQQ